MSFQKNTPVVISNVRFVAASKPEVATGLLGYVSAVVNSTLALDGLTLRRTAEGRLSVSFPSRRDTQGRQWFYLRPLDDAARREIQHQILGALGLEEARG